MIGVGLGGKGDQGGGGGKGSEGGGGGEGGQSGQSGEGGQGLTVIIHRSKSTDYRLRVFIANHITA